MAVHVGQGLQEGYWYWYCNFFLWKDDLTITWCLLFFVVSFFFKKKELWLFFQPKSDENFENFPPSNPFSNWGVYMTSCCAYTNWPRKQPPRFGTAKGSRCPLHGAWRLRFTTAADATFTRNSSRGTAKASRLERWWAADGGGWKTWENIFFLENKYYPMEFPTDIDILAGGNSNIFGIFTPIVGEMIPFWRIFFKWVGSTTN